MRPLMASNGPGPLDATANARSTAPNPFAAPRFRLYVRAGISSGTRNAEHALANFFFMFHSGLRYLVLLVGAVALVMLLVSVAKKRSALGGGFGAWRIFVILLDVQVLAGLLVVFTRPFLPQFIGHITMMALAMFVAHAISVLFKRRPAERQMPGLLLVGVVLCLALIVGGILAIGRPIV